MSLACKVVMKCGLILMSSLKAIIEPFSQLEGGLMPALHAIQEEEGYISNDAISELAIAFNYSKAEVLDVLTYYDDFSQEPLGKNIIRICRAEACQSQKSEELTQELTSHFGLDLHQTSGDSEITIKEVFCLGNCALGPSVMINDSVLGEASKDKVIKFLEKTEK